MRKSVQRAPVSTASLLQAKRFSQLMLLVSLGVGVLLMETLGIGQYRNFTFGCFLLVGTLYCRHLIETERMALGGVIMVTMSVVGVSLILAFNGGMHDPTALAFVIPIIIAALLGNRRFFFLTLGTIYTVLIALYAVENLGYYQFPAPVNNTFRLVAMLVFLGIGAAVMWQSASDVRAVMAIRSSEIEQADFEQSGFANGAMQGLFEQAFQTASRISSVNNAQVAVFRIRLYGLEKTAYAHNQKLRAGLYEATLDKIESCVRSDDVVGRYSNDEFVVIAADIDHDNQPQIVENIANKIMAQMVAAKHVLELNVRVGCNIGIALAKGYGQTFSEVMGCAEVALDQARRRQAQEFQLYDESLPQLLEEEAQAFENLRESIDKRELAVEFEPRFSVANGELVGAEALVVWNQNGKKVKYEDFENVAVGSGLVGRIDLYRLSQACKLAARLRANGFGKLSVAVSLHGDSLARSDAERQFMRVMDHWQVPANSIDIEVRYSDISDGNKNIKQQVSRFASIGHRINVVECPTASAVLTGDVPFSTFFAQKKLTNNIAQNIMFNVLLKSMVYFGDIVGVNVGAKGVESKADFAMLRIIGCSKAQGGILGTACNFEEFLQLAENGSKLLGE